MCLIWPSLWLTTSSACSNKLRRRMATTTTKRRPPSHGRRRAPIGGNVGGRPPAVPAREKRKPQWDVSWREAECVWACDGHPLSLLTPEHYQWPDCTQAHKGGGGKQRCLIHICLLYVLHHFSMTGTFPRNRGTGITYLGIQKLQKLNFMRSRERVSSDWCKKSSSSSFLPIPPFHMFSILHSSLLFHSSSAAGGEWQPASLCP